MVFVLVLCGLVIGVYLLLIALMLVAGFYGVFGAIVYGPFFIIRYIWRVFDGEDALEKSYDVRKTKKVKRVREPREVSNVRLTDRKPSKIKQVKRAGEPEVRAGQALKPRKTSSTVKTKKPSGVFQPRKASNIKPSGVFQPNKTAGVKSSANKFKTKASVSEVSHKVASKKFGQSNIEPKKPNPRKVEPKKSNPRNSSSKNPNPSRVESQGITPNIPTTSPLTDYPDMV